jgi:hypothetical protein
MFEIHQSSGPLLSPQVIDGLVEEVRADRSSDRCKRVGQRQLRLCL